jgi:YidC/Oxa1 family membrane protein insertase
MVIILYTSFFAPKTPKKLPEETKPIDSGSEKASKVEEEQLKPPPKLTPSLLPEGKLLTIKTPLYTGIIDTAGGRISEWRLEKFKETTGNNSPPVNLFKGSPPAFNTIPELKGIQIPDLIPFEFDGGDVINVTEKEEITLYWKSPEGIEIRKIYGFDPSSYLVELRFEVKNTTENHLGELLLVEQYGRVGKEAKENDDRSFITMVYNKVERVDKPPKEVEVFKGTINWFGFADKYFISAFLPDIGGETDINLLNAEQDKLVQVRFDYPSNTIPPANVSVHKSKLYLGPMEYEVLRSVGYGLENAIKYGWVGPLARPLLWLLKELDRVFKNYGIAIIVITIIVRIVFLPLTIKSMASIKQMQIKMQELKPKIDLLKEKYKDDKAKQNAELMKLYTSHGINPLSSLGGCLPLLIQLPVFIALYDVLLYSIDLRHSSFLWIKDLSEPEFLFNIPGIGIPFRILPLAMGASWYLSQKLTPTSAPGVDSMQMKMMEFMPLIFTVMFWGLPSGLILYWTVSNILSIVQQLYVNRRFIAPKGGIKDAGSDRKRRKNSV